MAKLLDRIKALFHDRRKSANVCMDRRDDHRKPTLKEADAKMREAMERLEQTARWRRDDFYDHMK